MSCLFPELPHPRLSVQYIILQIPVPVLKAKTSANSSDGESSARPGEMLSGTPEGEEAEGLHSLQTIARQVARSTGAAAQKIAQKGKDLSSLELATVTAERIARSTGDALQKMTTTWEEPVSSSEDGDLQRTAQDVAISTADTLHGVLLDMAQQTAERVAKSTGNAVDRLATVLQPCDSSVATQPWTPPPVDNATGMVVLPPSVSISDSSTCTRMLPSLPHMVEPLPASINHNGKVPSVNTSGLSLANGYQRSPLLSARNFKQDAYDGSWTKFTDSDSEYSTTESVELTSQLLAPAVFCTRGQQVVTSNTDLKTYPMLRMSHTAEMVAESTGKAVRKLTSTLS